MSPVASSVPFVVPLLVVVLATGCHSAAGPTRERVVGTIAAGMSSTAALESPVTALAGEPVTVTVTTVGSSSCTAAAGAEVIYRGAVVEITPYDWTAAPETACSRDMHPFPRRVTVRFPTMGTFTLRVTGRALTGELGGAVVEAPITVVGPD